MERPPDGRGRLTRGAVPRRERQVRRDARGRRRPRRTASPRARPRRRRRRARRCAAARRQPRQRPARARRAVRHAAACGRASAQHHPGRSGGGRYLSCHVKGARRACATVRVFCVCACAYAPCAHPFTRTTRTASCRSRARTPSCARLSRRPPPAWPRRTAWRPRWTSSTRRCTPPRSATRGRRARTRPWSTRPRWWASHGARSRARSAPLRGARWTS